MFHHASPCTVSLRSRTACYGGCPSLASGGLFADTDSLYSRSFRLLHLFDTMVVVDPITFPARPKAAGFGEFQVDVRNRMPFDSARGSQPRSPQKRMDRCEFGTRRDGLLIVRWTSWIRGPRGAFSSVFVAGQKPDTSLVLRGKVFRHIHELPTSVREAVGQEDLHARGQPRHIARQRVHRRLRHDQAHPRNRSTHFRRSALCRVKKTCSRLN